MFWVTNTFRVEMVLLLLLKYIFSEKNGTFTSLLWATLLSLLYLNAIQVMQVKNASIYSTRAVLFSGQRAMPIHE